MIIFDITLLEIAPQEEAPSELTSNNTYTIINLCIQLTREHKQKNLN